MLDFDELRKTLNDSDTEMKKNIKNLGTMAKDAERVSNIAGNASSVINNRLVRQPLKLVIQD